MDTSRHISLVFGFLNERAEYAVLRNYHRLPDDNTSRDIDIIISRKCFREIKRELVEVLCENGWKIITYLNSDRLITFVCAKNVGHETEIVQWDFFVNTSVWGVELMAAEEFLASRVWNGFLWHVDVVGEFLDKYLYNRAVGCSYPAKYEAIRRRIFDPHMEDLFHTEDILHTERTENTEMTLRVPSGFDLSPTDDTDCSDSNSSFSSIRSLTSSKIARRIDTDFNAGAATASSVLSVSSVREKESSVREKNNSVREKNNSVRKKEISVSKEKISVRVSKKLNEVFGCGDLERCDEMSGKRLLWNAVKWNLKRRPFALIAEVCAFIYSFVRNYLCSNTGFSIGFTGPDGVGKTTVIELLIARLGDVFRTAHAYMHFRPMLFGNLGEVAHSAGLKKDVDREYTKPHRGGRVGVVSSLVRLMYYSVDYVVGYWLKVKSQIRITRLVIFDRYYTDVICDSRRSRIFLNYRFLYWFGRVFIPRLDYNILLTAQTETILERKQELTREGIEMINEKIDYLAGKRGYKRVMNEATASETVTEILEWVFAEQHKRNMKRIV